MNRNMFRCVVFVCAVVLWLGINFAQATPVHLSDRSTNSNPNTLPTYLQADVDFSVSGSTLTLTCTNNTNATGHAFDINEIWFNVSDKITNLTSDPGAQWNFTFNRDAIALSGYGSFDARFYDGRTSKTIKPTGANSTKTFTLTISGTGPFTVADFTDSLSKTSGGEVTAKIGANFINPTVGTQEAYGVTVPEPATICILGFGLSALLFRRK
ncbi:MAG: PEP-CTERM sorting domain-containing protein [Phycisphaerae bacterium]